MSEQALRVAVGRAVDEATVGRAEVLADPVGQHLGAGQVRSLAGVLVGVQHRGRHQRLVAEQAGDWPGRHVVKPGPVRDEVVGHAVAAVAALPESLQGGQCRTGQLRLPEQQRGAQQPAGCQRVPVGVDGGVHGGGIELAPGVRALLVVELVGVLTAAESVDPRLPQRAEEVAGDALGRPA